MEHQKPGPFLIFWLRWWLLTSSFSIPIVVPSDDCKNTFKIFINPATQYTCELDFYHTLADGETKTQKGSMPYHRAQRGPVAELQTKQLECRYTNIWCCTLLLLLLLLLLVTSQNSSTTTPFCGQYPVCHSAICDTSDCSGFSCSAEHFRTSLPILSSHTEFLSKVLSYINIWNSLPLILTKAISHNQYFSRKHCSRDCFCKPFALSLSFVQCFHSFYVTNISPCLHFWSPQ